ncbi:phosphodiester glycosidase family protein [Streptomyces sp. NPDC056002]|uniref:phosphodiester glycosidase family protein n=1 Tax=Streptomyces sp. NPDC056002 TaxID=3345675 RepID=UPI0035E32169
MSARRVGRAGLAAGLALLAVAGCTTSGSGDNDRPRRVPSPAASSALPEGVRYEHSTQILADGEPVRFHVLSIAPDAHVSLGATHGDRLQDTSTVRELARQAGAVAAVNGTLFDIATGAHHSGYDGDPLGLYGDRGRLLSESVGANPALVLDSFGRHPSITEARSSIRVTSSDGAHSLVDGVDRVPGRILDCGGVGGDRPVTLPRHGTLCTDPDEIVDFRPEWGGYSPQAGDGSAEAVLDSRGRVTRLRTPAGGAIPRGGRTLVGIGKGAAWLRAHAARGRELRVSSRVSDAQGDSLGGPEASMVGGGPRLVRDGHVRVTAAANGFPPSALRTRHPRTVAGIKEDGTLLLVVIDGRLPGRSVGATFTEAARILVGLGAKDAVNLDGGGSSTMVVSGRVRNSPTDGPGSRPGERRVSNAIVVIPTGAVADRDQL